jgi:hypothetical protein
MPGRRFIVSSSVPSEEEDVEESESDVYKAMLDCRPRG